MGRDPGKGRPSLGAGERAAGVGKDAFPTVTGTPRYTDGCTRNRLPVKLAPGTKYVILINTPQAKNFRDRAGTPVAPFRFTFTTR